MKRLTSVLLCLLFITFSLLGCNKIPNEASGKISSSENSNNEISTVSGSLTSKPSSIGAKPILLSAFEEYENGQPKILWKNINDREGFSVTVIIKNSAGQIIENATAIVEDGYTVKAKLIEGETYSINLSYATASGKENHFGIGETFSYTHCPQKTNYYFNYAMPVKTLNNYLSRSMTYCIYAESDTWYGRFDSAMAKDAKRAILNVGAKHIARAISVWSPSVKDEAEYPEIKEWIADVHKSDSEIIFEACIFETCTENINAISIPEWVFKAFGKKMEKRNFNVSKMVFENGYGTDQWGKGFHIPDITREETQMWFYYRARTYIDMGCESLHLGQMNLIGNNDKDNAAWTKVISMIRDYAKKNARRHYVLINGHYPSQKLVSSVDKKLLVDFNAFPLRLKVAEGEKDHAASEENPQKCEINFQSDAPYNKQISGISPSGWVTQNYPYLVEFDNDGGDNNDHTIAKNRWGYDEISWFANQPQWYRHQFLKDIVSQVRKLGDNGHVALPGRRTAYLSFIHSRLYYVMNDAKHYENGFSDEAAIKAIWANLE